MSDYDRNVAARGFGAAPAVAIDAGLRAYMIRVYNYMAAGVALTGVVAWLTFNLQRWSPDSGWTHHPALTAFWPNHLQRAIGSSSCSWGTLGLVFFMSFRINSFSRAR